MLIEKQRYLIFHILLIFHTKKRRRTKNCNLSDLDFPLNSINSIANIVQLQLLLYTRVTIVVLSESIIFIGKEWPVLFLIIVTHGIHSNYVEINR